MTSERIRRLVVLSLLPWLVLLFGCDYRTVVETFPPETPVQIAPADTGSDYPTAIFLEWEKPTGAESYQLQFGLNDAFTDLLVNEISLTSLFYAVRELEVDSTYFWHVRAQNATGFSDWSPTWSFTPTSLAVLPEQPIQVYPPHNTYSLPTSIRFTWEEARDARFYHLQVSLEDDFYSREGDIEGISGTNRTISGLVYGYWYYWRVRAQNAAGYSAWSPARYLVVVDAG